MVARITSVTLLLLLLAESFTGAALSELTPADDESKQAPLNEWLCEGASDAEDDREDNGDLFVAPPSPVVASLLNMSCAGNDVVGNGSSARRLAAPRAPPIRSC